jgi:hypothetical protein
MIVSTGKAIRAVKDKGGRATSWQLFGNDCLEQRGQGQLR